MERGRIVLVGGGVRSGKSAFAERRAQALGHTRLYVATAEMFDAEMRERIERHRRERGTTFRTLECSRALPEALRDAQGVDVVLVDCLTLWLSNLLCDQLTSEAVHARFDALLKVLEQRRFHVVLVTNEVGLGIVPDNALARRFRDLAGQLHQRLGRISDEVYFGALGQLLRLKPGPIGLADEP